MTGFVHSIESFGAVDGPGIRLVVFMQGCTMRCAYCHNPDTWQIGVGNEMSAEEIIDRYNRNRHFYKNGGITVSGGEPLLQIDFLTELFRLAKNAGIHTCVDTSGAVFNRNDVAKFERLIEYTDLILLDIKQIDSKKHADITGFGNTNILDFARFLNERNIDVWIRHVVVPNLTDDAADLKKLGEFIANLSNVKALEVIPYHTYGVSKYAELGITYRLDSTEQLSEDALKSAKTHIVNGIKSKQK